MSGAAVSESTRRLLRRLMRLVRLVRAWWSGDVAVERRWLRCRRRGEGRPAHRACHWLRLLLLEGGVSSAAIIRLLWLLLRLLLVLLLPAAASRAVGRRRAAHRRLLGGLVVHSLLPRMASRCMLRMCRLWMRLLLLIRCGRVLLWLWLLLWLPHRLLRTVGGWRLVE